MRSAILPWLLVTICMRTSIHSMKQDESVPEYTQHFYDIMREALPTKFPGTLRA